MASSFLLLAGDAIAEALDLTSGDNEQFLKLNRHQCKYVAQKMSESRDVLQVLESDLGSFVRCEAALKELYRVLTNALSLIKDCRFKPSLKKDDRSEPSLSKDDHHESWLRAAITQRSYERSEDFAEICYDLQWCTSIVRIGRLQSGATLQDAILVPEDCDGRLGALDLFKLQWAANQDRDDLRSNLEPLKQGHVCDDSCELSQTDSSLAAHLLERLNSKPTPTTTEISTSSFWKVDAQDLPDGKFLRGGSFGSVMETEWLGQKHAKKVFGDATPWSVKMDSKFLAGLSHPHLLRIVGSSVNGRGKLKYALVMELMQEDLSEFLKRTTVPLSILTALDLMLQVARGLKYLHSRRITHRDLKSANILVASLTAAPELEYGSEPCLHAKLSLSLNSSTRYSHQTLIMGTRKWMAPEVLEISQEEIDHGSMEPSDRRVCPFKADVYRFAIVCSEILTKKEPFPDVPLRGLLERIRDDGWRPELPDGCPRRLASLIKRCWELEPRSRPDFPEICRELRYIKGLLLTGDERKDQEVDIFQFSIGPTKVQGTWGGDGIPFCDGVATGIKGFGITSDDVSDRCLQVEYDTWSQSCISRHGDYDVGNVEEVMKGPQAQSRGSGFVGPLGVPDKWDCQSSSQKEGFLSTYQNEASANLEPGPSQGKNKENEIHQSSQHGEGLVTYLDQVGQFVITENGNFEEENLQKSLKLWRNCLYRPGKELEEFPGDWIRTYDKQPCEVRNPSLLENDELDQVQLNEELCRYLDNVLVDIRINLDDPGEDLSTSKRDDRERALKELDLVVKRAESLIRKCMCEDSLWLDAAITLANIKEEILEIQLELSWWANMVEIASVQDLDSGESVVQNVVKAMRKQSALAEFLVKEGSSLQRAAEVDKGNLVSKLLRVKEEHAKAEDHEYVLSVYLLSQMKEDIHIGEMVRSKLKDIKWGKPLGRGAYGAVTGVTWIQRKCAVKTVNSSGKEVKMLSRCNHPHIVQFLWDWEEDSDAHIIMERMPRNLEKHIKVQAQKRGGQPFELHVAIDIMLQVAKAMQYLHKNKIVHRDLKTSNILVDDSTEGYVLVKLADFGLAKTYANTQTVGTQTIGGTTRYAAPEVNLDDHEMTCGKKTRFLTKADVWSFAMVCSEILTGKIPFEGMDVKQSEIHAKIAEPNFRPLLPNDSCFDDLRFCITSCWSHYQENRPDFSAICQMLKLAKMLSLGVTSFDTCKSLFSQNPPIWMDPKNDHLESRSISASMIGRDYLEYRSPLKHCSPLLGEPWLDVVTTRPLSQAEDGDHQLPVASLVMRSSSYDHLFSTGYKHVGALSQPFLAYAPDCLQQLSSQDDPADLVPAWPATAAPLARQAEPLQHFARFVNSGYSQAAGRQLQDVVPVGSIPDVQLSFSADLGAGLQGEFPQDQQVINVAASSRPLLPS